jgi:CheY-like chemotaxis protein
MLFPVAGDKVAAKPALQLRGLEPQGQAETILVVEDNTDVLELARDHLMALGYTVLSARDADEALTAFDAAGGKVDLLFTDLVMPGSMNGLALVDVVRERSPDIAVLLTTGYNEELLMEGPKAIGADVLGKPYRRPELADRVRAALNGRGRAAAAAREPGYRGPRHEG